MRDRRGNHGGGRLRGEGRSRPRYRRLSRHRHAQTVRRVERARSAPAPGVQARIVSPTFRESLADFIGLIARQHYDAVLLFGLYYDPQIAAVARRYPKVPFVLIHASRADMPKAPPNVAGEVLQYMLKPRLSRAGWPQSSSNDDQGRTSSACSVLPWIRQRRRSRIASPRKLDTQRRGSIGPCPLLQRLRRPYEVRGPRASSDHQQGAGVVFNVAGACGLVDGDASGL